MNLHEVTVINDRVDDILHIVRFVGVIGNHRVQGILYTCGIILALLDGSLFHVVLRDEADKTANLLHGLLLSSGNEVGYTRLGGMNAGTAQLLNGNVLTGNALYNLRSGDEHI